MSYTCANWQHFTHGSNKFYGNGQCAVFVEMVAKAPRTHFWTRGVKVLGNGHLIPPGTAIATFDSAGVYPNRKHGNHAALFVSEDGKSITVVDQYRGAHSHHPGISHYTHRGTGSETSMTGDPNYYFVIE